MQGIGAMQGARRLALLLVLQLLAAVVVTAASAATTTTTTTTKRSGALELPHANLTAAIDGWTADTAVMFYAPWCKYCKQLKPSWDQIAKLTTPQYRDLRVTIFNCEEPTANAELCATLGVDRYPSLYYFGYSSFNQAPRGNPFGASEFGGRVARFNADLYPEAIFEWVKMLSSVSSWQRKWADVTGIFTGRSHHTSRLEALARENAALQRKVSIFGTELEKHRADKLFDSVLDSGDPFPQLHLLTPAASNLALRTCIGEMVREYCKYHQEDKEDRQYCAIIGKCCWAAVGSIFLFRYRTCCLFLSLTSHLSPLTSLPPPASHQRRRVQRAGHGAPAVPAAHLPPQLARLPGGLGVSPDRRHRRLQRRHGQGDYCRQCWCRCWCWCQCGGQGGFRVGGGDCRRGGEAEGASLALTLIDGEKSASTYRTAKSKLRSQPTLHTPNSKPQTQTPNPTITWPRPRGP